MKNKFKILFTVFTILLMILSGCSNSNKAGNTTGTDATQADKAFNETIDLTGVNKDKKSEEENGRRIVMDSVALSQVADKLDLKLAGIPTTRLGKMPERYNNTIQIGLPMNPNMEVLKSIKPSMVYAPDSLQDWIKEGFEKNNIPYKFVDIRSVDGLYKVTEDLATEFGKLSIYENLKNEREEFFKKYNKKIEGKKKPKVLILMGLPGSYLAAGEKSYVGNLVKLAGGENIIKNSEEFSQLNLETALNEQPDFILRTAHAMPDVVMEMFKKEFETNKSWSHFSAVKNNKVIDLDSKIFGMTAGYDYQTALNSLFDTFYK
ncbi:heme ABC transporter substrate-binding protein IsdE [Gemella cuniculi]|uniref:heme ABC transporter substrate-binding protein IsdE n=1 Tax=Gemella cuniculi TaxID=150240 RepID=UPI0003F510F9|nr:heme ABC transporter substrate-binding protein IsdE [Gemella cuniculi]